MEELLQIIPVVLFGVALCYVLFRKAAERVEEIAPESLKLTVTKTGFLVIPRRTRAWGRYTTPVHVRLEQIIGLNRDNAPSLPPLIISLTDQKRVLVHEPDATLLEEQLLGNQPPKLLPGMRAVAKPSNATA